VLFFLLPLARPSPHVFHQPSFPIERLPVNNMVLTLLLGQPLIHANGMACNSSSFTTMSKAMGSKPYCLHIIDL
jgi:hypothetical protein